MADIPTTHYGFPKPNPLDLVDITKVNALADALDAKMYTIEQIAGSVLNMIDYDYGTNKYESARPAGVANGKTLWQGPVEPTGAAIPGGGQGWLDRDPWIDES
jgi:hypothetical protein